MDLERDENGTVRVEAKGDLLLIEIDRPKKWPKTPLRKNLFWL